MDNVLIAPTMKGSDFAGSEEKARKVVDLAHKLIGALIESVPPVHEYALHSGCRSATVKTIRIQVDQVIEIMTSHGKLARECRERMGIECLS